MSINYCFSRLSENLYFEVGETYICGHPCVTSNCYFAFVLPILKYCSPMWGSAAECHLQLLERQVYSVAMLCPDQSSCRCHRRRLAGLSILYKVIETLITVCSASFDLLLLEFDKHELRPQLIHWSLKYQGVVHHNLQGLSYWLRLECEMTFPTLCLILERWIGSRVQSTVGSFPELCFLFPWHRCLCRSESNL